MSLTDSLVSLFNLPSKKDMEQLQEQVAVQERLISDNSNFTPETWLSSQARESKKVEDIQGLVQKRVPVKSLQHLYLRNQFIFRGVNVRADELITRGYKIAGGDDEGVKACQKLIEDSGGENLFWQFSINTDVAGDGYLEKVPNKKGDKLMILKHINPLNFTYLTDYETDKIIIDSNAKPKAYMQVFYDNEGKQVRKTIEKSRIAHLKFNTFADEFNGISSIQPVFNTAIRLMNMENAAAEAAVKTANPLIIGETTTKSPHELAKWSKVLSNISAKEQVFLPDGVTLKMLSPGMQNFSAYSDYFLDAVVAALGVPKSILTGSSDSSSGNRSTVAVQSSHFYSVIRANQRYIEDLFNEIFKDYAERAGFKAPTLQFVDMAEDSAVGGKRALELYGGGIITLEEAREIIGLETPKEVVDELRNTAPAIPNNNSPAKGTIDPDTEKKKQDAKVYHPAEPGSPAGSQKGKKAKQKVDVNVPSVS